MLLLNQFLAGLLTSIIPIRWVLIVPTLYYWHPQICSPPSIPDLNKYIISMSRSPFSIQCNETSLDLLSSDWLGRIGAYAYKLYLGLIQIEIDSDILSFYAWFTSMSGFSSSMQTTNTQLSESYRAKLRDRFARGQFLSSIVAEEPHLGGL